MEQVEVKGNPDIEGSDSSVKCRICGYEVSDFSYAGSVETFASIVDHLLSEHFDIKQRATPSSKIVKPSLGNFHVKKWISRKAFKADCPICKGERLFQHENPFGEGYAWFCNTDSKKSHGIKTEDLDSQHPEWKNRPIQE